MFFMFLSGMFSPLIMPLAAYEELHNKFAMPLPLPLPSSVAGNTDLHYMSFEEAVLHPYSDMHQPSLQNRRRNDNLAIGGVALGDREPRSAPENEQNNKLAQARFIRGVVHCKDCMKPRCLYSETSPSRMKPVVVNGATEPTAHAIRMCREYAIQKLEEAQDNDLYVCGMQPLDADDLMHGVIVTRHGLECHHSMEFEYYSVKIVASWFKPKLCAYCAGLSGSEGIVDEELSLQWKSVLPVCPACSAKGALPLARTRRRNGVVNERRAQRARLVAPPASLPPSDDVAPPPNGESIPQPAVGPRVIRRRRPRIIPP